MIGGEKTTAVAVVVLALLLAGTVWFAYAVYRAESLNAQIGQAEAEAIDDDAPVEALFAKAYRAQQAGDVQQSVEIYDRILPRVDNQLAVAIHYNLGNLYFLQAALAADNLRLREVAPLVIQAQAQYQRVLFLDSGHMDAKYNLEYVQRMVQRRDLESEKSGVGVGTERTREGTSWTGVHELPEGLP